LRLGDLILKTQGPPDADSRALTLALLASGRSAPPLVHTLSRYLLGRETADALGVPGSPRFERWLPTLMRATIGTVDQLRARWSVLDAMAVQRGSRYWDGVVMRGLGEHGTDYRPPAALRSA
jgi:hypothetical protein